MFGMTIIVCYINVTRSESLASGVDGFNISVRENLVGAVKCENPLRFEVGVTNQREWKTTPNN